MNQLELDKRTRQIRKLVDKADRNTFPEEKRIYDNIFKFIEGMSPNEVAYLLQFIIVGRELALLHAKADLIKRQPELIAEMRKMQLNADAQAKLREVSFKAQQPAKLVGEDKTDETSQTLKPDLDVPAEIT